MNNFKATALWNEVIEEFTHNIPVKRSRFYKGSFEENTFKGKKAIDFLYDRLQKNNLFEVNITKKKVNLLLDKMLKANVFHNVGAKTSNDFKPYRLYRITAGYPIQRITSPHKSINIKPVSFRGRVNQNMSDEDIHVCMNDLSNYQKGITDVYLLLRLTKSAWLNTVINGIKDLSRICIGKKLDLDSLLCTCKTCLPAIWPCINASAALTDHFQKYSLAPLLYKWLEEIDKKKGTPKECEEHCEYLKLLALKIYGFFNTYDKPLLNPVTELMLESYSYLNDMNAMLESGFHTRDVRHFDSTNCSVLKAKDYLWNLSTPSRVMENRRGCRNFVNGQYDASKLPSGLCFETVFSTDEPVTRIVPKSMATAQSIATNNRSNDPISDEKENVRTGEEEGEHLNYEEAMDSLVTLIRHSGSTYKENKDYIVIDKSLFDDIVKAQEEHDKRNEGKNIAESSTISINPVILGFKGSSEWRSEVKKTAIELLRLEMLLMAPNKRAIVEVALSILKFIAANRHKFGQDFGAILENLIQRILDCDYTIGSYRHFASYDLIEFIIMNQTQISEPFPIDVIRGVFRLHFKGEQENQPPNLSGEMSPAETLDKMPTLPSGSPDEQPNFVTDILNSLFKTKVPDKEQRETDNINQTEHFCRKMSPAEYSDSAPTREALVELLDQLVKDQRLSEREKMRKIILARNCWLVNLFRSFGIEVLQPSND